MQRYIMFPNIPNYRELVGSLAPPKLGGWGSEQSNLRALVGVLVPPKLGGWGSEPPHFMCNTDKVLTFFISYVIRPILLQREGSTGVYGISSQYVPLFRPPTP